MQSEKLKPWPFYGYAPGAYMVTCTGCQETFCDLDKRAIRCLDCAVIAAKSATRPLSMTGEMVEAGNAYFAALDAYHAASILEPRTTEFFNAKKAEERLRNSIAAIQEQEERP